MICNGLRPSELSALVLLQTIVNTGGKCFHLNPCEAIADKRTTNLLRSEEKKERTYFKSDWTCFKANNSVLPILHRSSQTHVSIKNCLSRKRRNQWSGK